MHGYMSLFLGGHEVYNGEISFSLSHTNFKLLSFLQASTTICSNTPLISIVAMRLLFLLLFCTQLFVSVSASSPRSDLWSRGASMSRYIVTPVDPANTTATENILKSMFGEANIMTSKHQHKTTFWAITSSSEDIIASRIEALEGVQQVERQDLAARAQTVSTDVERYTVQPKENADDAKMDDFLKSKIQPDTLMVTVKQPDGKVMVWFNAALSQEAKEEVEKYDGTEKLIPLLSVASSSASTASASPQSKEKRSDVAARHTQHYGALAADDTNITETEEFLRSKVKNPEDILQHSRKDVVYGWYNLELDAETKKDVETYGGIKAMRLSKTLAEFMAPIDNDSSQPDAKRSETVVQDTQLYNATAKASSDTKKTEEFLKTKIKSPDRIYQQGRDGNVTGWYHLELDLEAKKAVEEHEGIEHVNIMKKMEWFGEVPEEDSVHSQLEARRSDVLTWISRRLTTSGRP
jgi:hypothetical protein